MTTNSTTTTAPPEGGAERRGMDDTKLADGRRWRHKMLSAAAVAGGALILASTAWACTLRIGTVELCRIDPAPVGPTGCSSVSLTAGQVNTTDVDDNGSSVRIRASKLLKNTPYTVTFRKPWSNAGCHRPTIDGGVTSVLGTTGGFPNTVTADNNGEFTVTGSTSNTNDPSPPRPVGGATTGGAQICVQDTNIETLDHHVVTGNVLDVNVALL